MFRGLVFGVFLGFVLVSRRMGFCWEVVFGVFGFVFCFGLCARGVGVFGAVRVFLRGAVWEKRGGDFQSHMNISGSDTVVNGFLQCSQVTVYCVSSSKCSHLCSSFPQVLQRCFAVYVSPSFSRVKESRCSRVLQSGQ